MEKAHLVDQLNSAHIDVVDWFNKNPGQWNFAPPEKWTAGQHLEHLIRSLKPLNKALGSPKIALRWSFGKPNRPLRSLEEVEDKYRKGMAAGFKTVGPFIPPAVEVSVRTKLLDDYRDQHTLLEKRLNRWSEAALDRYLLPHPALGKMMIREILYFTIIHTKDHLRMLRERYEVA